jgi:Zn-dependent peptidase ImmA (M78 family)/transcriptional regulator with XRE-family HTH domain
MIYDRIRRARILRGLSLEELAQLLGDITKQALSKFEKGMAMPNSTRILQLAKALQVKPEYFFRSETITLAPLEFRKLAKMPKYQQSQVEEQMREHLERYMALEQCFESVNVRVEPTPANLIAVSNLEQAEKAANQLRVLWSVGDDAIAHLTELLEDHGIKVALLDGPNDFDGACAASHDQQHVLISLNRNRPGERLRFTAAHELGHWIMALPEEMLEREKENCCHRFAGALLYPAVQVEVDFGSHKRSKVHLAELLNAKRRFGISMQVALRRLKDLELLTEAGYKSAFIQISQKGWRSAEPEPLLAEQPRRFESLVYWGMSEELFTPSRAAEFLQRPIDEIDSDLQTMSGN